MRKNVSSIQKKSLRFCLILMSISLLSLNSLGQFSATWNLRAAPAKTSTVTGVQAANVTAGLMDPGAAFIPNGSHNNDGFRCQPGSGNWPNVITAGFFLDFPLSPANNLIANITSITFTARTSGSSGNNVGKFEYQANGSGPWIDLGNSIVIPGGGSNNLTLNGLNAPFVTGNTYIIRMNIYAEGTNTSASRTVFIRDLVINGNTIVAGPPPTVLTTTATPTAQSTATVGGNLTDIGLSPMIRTGICWSTTINPTIANNVTTNGPLTPSTYTGNLTGLQANTQYFARAYATNLVGTSYGDNVTFTTLPPVIPTLTTTPASAITGLSANSGGTITYDGAAAITAKGVCWATTPNPTIANNITSNGSGNAAFSSQLALLAPNTTYFVRAYATNSVGTGYGNEISFTTPASSPTIIAIPSTINFGNVTINSNSAPQSFAVTAISLTPASGNVTLTAPTHYQISLSANGPFSTTLNLPYTGGTLATTTIYIRFSPTIFGILNGTLTISGGTAPNANVTLSGVSVQSPSDLSNTGTDFWVGYGYQSLMSSSNNQQMVLYFSSKQDAVVTVEIPSLGYTQSYNVTANTALVSNPLPKAGVQDARLFTTGVSNRAIHVYSNGIPISVWAHIYASQSSGATMVLPTNTWGSDYRVLTVGGQTNSGSPHSFFFVIASEDNTVVDITPSADITANSQGTTTLYPANVPFSITLNKGQVFNAMGKLNTSSNGVDLTGTTVKSRNCQPIAVFTGNGRVQLSVGGCSFTDGGSDNLIQQMFPKGVWGYKYLTVPFKDMEAGFYRVMVNDPTTVVRINGTALPTTSLINGFYYQIETAQPNMIESDKPVSVAQFIATHACNGTGIPGFPNTGIYGDPEMVILSPVEQAIKDVTVFSASQFSIQRNYINVVVKNSGVGSFTLDGVNVSSQFTPHPADANFSIAQFSGLAGGVSHTIISSEPFNATAYGFTNNSDHESYGYNAGTLLKDLEQALFVQNPYAISTDARACKDVPFKFRVTLPYPAGDVNTLTWNFFNTPNLLPNSNTVTQTAPAPDSTFVQNGKTLYLYSISVPYTFATNGTYPVKVTANVTDLAGCSGNKEYVFNITVVDGVIANFNTTNNLRVCLNDSTRFVDASNGQGFPLTKWQWNFGNSTIDSVKNPVRFLSPAGNYIVSLRAINSLGCYADVTKTVRVLTLPTANFTHNAPVCLNNTIAFNSSTSTGGGGTINNWGWNFGDNTTSAAQNPSKSYTTANTFTVKLNVTTADGCKDSTTRTVTVLPVLTAPVVVTGSITANSIQFNWAAVTGAVGYEVSVDGSGFTLPSSGATGLSHVVNGLQPNQTVNITVRALGTLPCQSATGTASGTTLLPDVGIFVPNTFTPNGDGRNDIVRVYGNYIKSLNFQIYNQWGEKVFETNDVNGGWSGMYKNKPQPVGVYVYVLRVENTNGEIVNKRGSINLIK